MCENESVTQSFSGNSEEDIWLLKGVNIHAEKDLVMKKRFKISIFAMLMSTIMLITSMSVMAAVKYKSDEIALSGLMGTATIWIEEDEALFAGAESIGATSTNEILRTTIYGGGPTPHFGEGYDKAEVFASADAFTYAESDHLWSGRHWSMTILP